MVLLVAFVPEARSRSAPTTTCRTCRSQDGDGPPRSGCVVANAALTLGTELGRDDLTTVDWPASAVPEGAFDDTATLVGRGLIASVVRHEPILAGKLASKEAGSGLPPITPPASVPCPSG